MSENAALQVMHRLKDDIVKNVYDPDQKLVMAKLKDRYGAGVGPLREALSLLIGDGLVYAEDQRGYRVTPISIDDMRDIYETRARVEALSVRLSFENGDDDWEADVVARSHNLFKLQSASDKATQVDIDDWDRRHDLFHTALVSRCALQHLLQIRVSLRDKALRYKRIWLRETVTTSYLFKENFSEHEELVKLAMARDADAACNLIYTHLMHPVDIIEQALAA